MRTPLARPTVRAALVPLFSLCLLAAACGDDLEPSDDGDDDGGDDTGDDGGDDDQETIDVRIDGLDGPVDVFFDSSGIMHARCASDADCFAAEGYVHAAHRFGQMDIRRRVGRGRIGALAGAIAVELSDKDQRRMMTARDGSPLEERLLENADARTMAALEAYSRGVNAWLQDLRDGVNGAALPDEYSSPMINQDALMAALQDPWEPVDSVACILPLVDQLTNHAGLDLTLGELFGTPGLTPEAANDLFGLDTPSDSAILPPQIGAASSDGRGRAGRGAAQRMAGARPLLQKALEHYPDVKLDASSLGSNNWIVGPSQTSGGALLANDPHLGMSHPSVWYIVHLDAKTTGDGDIHVAGASFPGLPGVLLGHNEDIAWGATTTYFDQTDVYLETLNEAGDAVIFNGEEVALQEVEYTFEVAGGDPITETFQFVPHHGPIIEIDEEAGTAVSVRWVGHDADTDINFFLGLATAATIEEARTALLDVTTAGQNFVVIDRTGDIGWFPYNRIPERPFLSPELPSWLPLPGDGSAEWGDFLPYEQLPQAVNPPGGFLATANNDMTGALQDGDPLNDGQDFVQALVDEGYRHEQIVRRLGARDDHDLASMQSIQADVFSLLGNILVPEVLAAVDPETLEADGRAVYDALAAWAPDPQCRTGIAGTAPDDPADPDTVIAGRGCAAFHVTWSRLRALAFADELEEAGLPGVNPRPAAMIFALIEPETLSQDYWDNVTTEETVETEADIVAAALNAAGAYLRAELGEPDLWLWGRIHTVALVADLFGNFTGDFNSGAYTNDGGLFTVDVANPRNEDADQYNQTAGPSMRFACNADEPGVTCTIELPGGQRHLRDSPFYTTGSNTMLDEWLTNKPVPLVFTVDEVAADPADSLLIQPR
jgi:penicillin amidase